ncbi:sensor histidine kinase [Actinoplanes sp. NPDC051470]|uniref:sensor histidine kinase n=1 Tax=Actinoplanes sp. NPDC051470 TaxID=3157224 RepID=UPI003419F2BC
MPDEWQRPGPTPRQRRIDLWIALGVTAGAVLNVAMARSAGMFIWHFQPGAPEHYAWAVAISVPLVWRRAHPTAVFIVVSLLFLAGQIRGAQETQFAGGVLFASMYALGAWGRDRQVARWTRIIVITGMLGWVLVSWLLSLDMLDRVTDGRGPFTPTFATLVNLLLVNVGIFAGAYLAGEGTWLAARRQHQLEEQAEQLRTAQEKAEERAVLGERVRIARELHDVVAHHVSVMGIQASAARKALDKDAGKTRAALTAVEESARTAVAELRRMLGALRAGDTAPEETPFTAAGLDRVEELLVRVREAGLTAELTTYGEPVPLPDSVTQAAYRIVQEALTNVLKHAHASTVDVRIRYLSRELEVDVADDGRGSAVPATGGMGLIGMRERVAVHDGSIEAGPRADGGYRVRVRLPLELPSIPAQRSAEPAAHA